MAWDTFLCRGHKPEARVVFYFLSGTNDGRRSAAVGCFAGSLGEDQVACFVCQLCAAHSWPLASGKAREVQFREVMESCGQLVLLGLLFGKPALPIGFLVFSQ